MLGNSTYITYNTYNTYNNTINNTVNNITINNYGSENLDYITDNKMMELIFPPSQSIVKLSNLIHLNEEHPENHNLAVTNINGKYIHVRKNNKWVKCFKTNVLPNVITSSYEKLENFYKENGKKMPEYYTKRMNNYYNAFLEHEIVGAKLAKEFELLLYNKSNGMSKSELNNSDKSKRNK